MDKETAMKILKELYDNSLSAERTALKTIIPELEESEDERMVKFIKKQLFNIKKTITENYELDAKLTKAIDWLEKQGDDIKKIKELENKIESLQKCFKIANDEIADKSQELYALKCKIEDEGYQWDEEKKEPRKINSYCKENCKGYQETGRCFADGGCEARRKAEQKTAWGEDERMIKKVIEALSTYADKLQYEGFCHNKDVIQDYIDWLKSLKDRYTWKPTEEQLVSLSCAIDALGAENDNLTSLYEILKKL